ncbi:MAG: DUF4238 domain-containing protein [Rhodobacteraceae bacterium]|nr:DUF4238 domain-containing protein [Paracoccaceae bacterium]
MAGKNHHHIWQLLQRGFGEKSHGDHHIWVYEKGNPPKKTVTRKYGAIKFFYGPEGSSADTNITNFENATQSFIQDARKAENGEELDPAILAPIIAHLEMRSMFLRDQISNLGERLLKTLRDYVASEKHAIKLFSSYLNNHPELIDEVLDDNGIQGEHRQIAKAYAAQLMPNATKQGAKEVSKLVGTLFNPLLEEIANTARNAHIKSLESSFAAIDRTNMHLERDYFIHRTNNAQFILPDTTLAFLMKRGASPISQKDDHLEQVLFPISSDTIVVGRARKTAIRDDATINRILANCAFSSFIAKNNCVSLSSLSSRIGRNAKVIKDSELKKMLSFDQLLQL